MVVFNFAKWFWINTKSQKDEYGEFFALPIDFFDFYNRQKINL